MHNLFMKILLSLFIGIIMLGCKEEGIIKQSINTEKTDSDNGRPYNLQSQEDLKFVYEEARKMYASEPNDANRETLVSATAAYGDAMMRGPGAPKEKYPLALKLFDEALKLDPENELAKEGKTLILSIYESMGRTPPKID
jgi:hypothetical protein